MAKIAAADIDFTSLDPVVRYTGGIAPGDVPHRDLNAADLAYVFRVRALQKSSGEPVGPARPMDVAATANDLLEYPGFSARAAAEPTPKAKGKAKAKAKAKATTAAAAPAPEPLVTAPADKPIAHPAAPANPAEEN